MAEYRSNSHRSREVAATEPKQDIKVEKVVNGKVKVKKKNGARKFADNFLSDDVSSIKSYVIDDLIAPTFKKLIFEVGRDALEIALFGKSGGGSRRDSGRSRISYREYFDDGRRSRDRRDEPRRNRFDYDDLVFETYGDALAVYEGMLDILDRYKLVTVAAMYDLANEDIDYTANNYGWTDLRVHEPVRRGYGGYYLALPKAYPLD